MIDEPPWEKTKLKLQKYGIFHVRPPLEQAKNVPILDRKSVQAKDNRPLEKPARQK